MRALRILLHYQLSENMSSLIEYSDNDTILLCESKDQLSRVQHHKKKLVLWLSCIRHFVNLLIDNNKNVVHIKLDSENNSQIFTKEIDKILAANSFEKIVITKPCDYDELQMVLSWRSLLNIPVEILEDENFMCSINEFKSWSNGRNNLLMEHFYRYMRKKHNILMENGKPLGGKWNYDNDNRKRPTKELSGIDPKKIPIDIITEEVINIVSEYFSSNFGSLDNFIYAVTRVDALKVLRHFIKYKLSKFGSYQDAMITGEMWMYHSQISFYLNANLITPRECIEHALKSLEKGAPINSVEGFVRQILGWREYIRGIYWNKMPSYRELNYFNSTRSLPDIYWGKKTQLNCINQCIRQTYNEAYAHHIQRLMVLGNFALITGISPKEVNQWYHIVYADAYEWVELPNVTGMILFADGGYLGTKPYAASGSYINKMSDYCKKCSYNVKEKTGDSACPFNYLYWYFLLSNRSKLGNNHRLAMVYNILDNKTKDEISEIVDSSEKFLNNL